MRRTRPAVDTAGGTRMRRSHPGRAGTRRFVARFGPVAENHRRGRTELSVAAPGIDVVGPFPVAGKRAAEFQPQVSQMAVSIGDFGTSITASLPSLPPDTGSDRHRQVELAVQHRPDGDFDGQIGDPAAHASVEDGAAARNADRFVFGIRELDHGFGATHDRLPAFVRARRIDLDAAMSALGESDRVEFDRLVDSDRRRGDAR